MQSLLRLILAFFFLLRPCPSLPASAELLPEDRAQHVSLYPILEWTGYDGSPASCSLTDADGTPIDGVSRVENGALRFYPYRILTPDTEYRFSVECENKVQSCTFTTTDVPMPRHWVEVILGDVQKVLVWENSTVVQAFPCSGGTEETPSILGIYAMQNRGERFYSARVREGAHYWIRLSGNYLFHGIPRDENDEPIPGEEEKIGTAASHGCIRLHDDDAKWLYDHLPDGTLVVLHPGMPAL